MNHRTGTPRPAGANVTRRETLALGASAGLGGLAHQPDLVAKSSRPASRPRPAKAKSVVLLYLQGGPPTQDMFDLKPDAPAGIRSEFKPVASSAPGISVCEL